MIEKDEKKESHLLSVRGPFISFFLALGIFPDFDNASPYARVTRESFQQRFDSLLLR